MRPAYTATLMLMCSNMFTFMQPIKGSSCTACTSSVQAQWSRNLGIQAAEGTLKKKGSLKILLSTPKSYEEYDSLGRQVPG